MILEKRIKLERADQKTGILGIGGKGYPFTVSYDKYKGEAYIQSKPLEIPEKDTSMSHLRSTPACGPSGAGRGRPKASKRQVTIPGKYTLLRIDSAELSVVRNERYEPEQVLVVRPRRECRNRRS